MSSAKSKSLELQAQLQVQLEQCKSGGLGALQYISKGHSLFQVLHLEIFAKP